MKMSENTPAAWGIVAGLYTFFLCLAAMSLSCASVPRGSRPLEQRDRFAVRITTECSWNGWHSTMSGSGTIIGPREVLTAQHVITCPPINSIPGKLELVITIDYQRSIRAMVVTKEWHGRDIARLGTATTFGDVKPPAIAPVGEEKIVTSVSFPMRGMTFGWARGARNHNACPFPGSVFCHDFTFSAPVQRGNSGGAVYDADGALVGVITGGFFEDKEDITALDGLASSVWPIRSEIFAP